MRDTVLAREVRVAPPRPVAFFASEVRAATIFGVSLNVDVLCLEDRLDEALVLRVVDRERRAGRRLDAHGRTHASGMSTPTCAARLTRKPARSRISAAAVRERDRDVTRPRSSVARRSDAVRENASCGTRARRDQQRRSACVTASRWRSFRSRA